MAKQKLKLTPAQLELLKERQGSFTDSYKPGMRLIELGLIDVRKPKIGNLTWKINEAGEAYLAG